MKRNITCPRCGQPIPSAEHAGQYPGALSRYDNKTEICSSCGVAEAMAQLAGYTLSPPNQSVLESTRTLRQERDQRASHLASVSRSDWIITPDEDDEDGG